MSPSSLAIVFFPDFLGPVIHMFVSFGSAGSLSKFSLGRLIKVFRLFSFSKINTRPAYSAAN